MEFPNSPDSHGFLLLYIMCSWFLGSVCCEEPKADYVIGKNWDCVSEDLYNWDQSKFASPEKKSTLYKPSNFCYLIDTINVENGIMVRYISHLETLKWIFEKYKIFSEKLSIKVADVAVTQVGLVIKGIKAQLGMVSTNSPEGAWKSQFNIVML